MMQVTELTQDLFEAIEKALLQSFSPANWTRDALYKDFALICNSTIYNEHPELGKQIDNLRVCDVWQIIIHLQDFTIPAHYERSQL